jgi:CDP-diacylglycerol--glycerol-3-phosphate 3-phosphatidyltransferase
MANTITLARLPFLVVIVTLLYLDVPQIHVVTAGLVLLLILMDTLDGMIARRRREVGMLGSKLDIAVDRIVEMVLWVVYANLGLIPVAVPIIVIIRGGLVDTVRSFSLVWGETSFGMMRTRLGQWLVGGSVMRTLYGLVKAIAFCTLALALGLRGLWAGTSRADGAEAVYLVAVIASWTAVAICLVRGIPVLWEARTRLRDLDEKVAEQAGQQ